MAETLAEQLAVEETGPGQYVSLTTPERMGNALPIAYGGCTLGIATHAAYQTVKPAYSLYSLVGHFLGPASTNEKLKCTVHETRTTKTFATRRVQVSQLQPDGKMRACMELIADFQVEEPAMLSYTTPPSRKYSGVEGGVSLDEMKESAVSQGKVTRAAAEKFHKGFRMMDTFFDSKYCPEGIAAQNVFGGLKNEPTSQDHLPITEKSSADWIRTRVPLESRGERMGAVSFLIDGAIAFTPLAHNHMWLDDSAACSTLDFALRIFVPDIDINSWHLRERRTMAAGYGRSYSEARLWDEQGTMVASMTQQCILRPKPEAKAKAAL
ncbi:hypothetical protein JX265_007254 [Neoarthrinium moseri]|uniref:Uncharacterized protein n=1 Tax=Neoarthrinium moseri TaxID=1658444 RepID=A0A9P9WK43_9PEZI|nr:uncharacterized protein JN550_012126 [Neoarthrinium moseri]KAI1859317.1 hypothetical protein JN550_012126 [Neoarthrinium moseri]KAI1867452.1 hypothetical protein JX265_007254 [Neoarthrinium moseri]